MKKDPYSIENLSTCPDSYSSKEKSLVDFTLDTIGSQSI